MAGVGEHCRLLNQHIYISWLYCPFTHNPDHNTGHSKMISKTLSTAMLLSGAAAFPHIAQLLQEQRMQERKLFYRTS
jgi:hypothetical protein